MKTVTLIFAFILGLANVNMAQETLQLHLIHSASDQTVDITADHLHQVLSISLDDETFTITEFTLSMIVNGSLVESKSEGSHLTETQLSLLKNAKVGEKVFIENIKAQNKNGETRLIAGSILNVL